MSYNCYYPKYIVAYTTLYIFISTSIYMYISYLSKFNFRMDRRHELTFSLRRHTNGQQAHEKMLNIANHQRNGKQNHSEVPPHTCQNGYHPQDHVNKDHQ